MTRTKTIIGALVLCAVWLSAAATAGAVEPKPGLTAVTCTESKEVGGGNFETNHCVTPEKTKSNWETKEIPENTATKVTGEGIVTEGEAGPPAVLETTLTLLTVKITCNKVHTTGEVTNTLDPVTGEHRAHGTNIVTHYTECEAHLKSKTAAEEACEIENLTEPGKGNKSTISTNPLTSTTGENHKVTFSEPKGGEISKFKIIKNAVTGTACSIPTTEVPITGTAIARANTTTHSHLTFEGEGTLKVGSAASHYFGTNVGYMEEPGGEPGQTVGLTTTTAEEK